MTHVAYGIPVLHLVLYARDHREYFSKPEHRRMGDGTSMLFPPTFIHAGCDINYLPGETPDHRESADECASSRNRIG